MRVQETPEEAVLREAVEETGLTGLAIRRFLGTAEYDVLPFGRDEIHIRHFFHAVPGHVMPMPVGGLILH